MGRSDIGARLLARVGEILTLTAAVTPYPGEGLERAFRAWLKSMLLVDLLKWPDDKVVIGERFDVLLMDRHGFPVATIETKEPGHRITSEEQSAFESRLSGIGTLQVAYISDGHTWQRLDLLAPTGTVVVHTRESLDIGTATTTQAEAFFAPLFAQRYFGPAHRVARLAASSDSPYALELLSDDLGRSVSALVEVLAPLFDGLVSGLAGDGAASVTAWLFELWCHESNVVSPGRASRLLSDFLRSARTTSEVLQYLTTLGLAGANAHASAAELASCSRLGSCPANAIAESLSPLFEDARAKLMAQTAHVIVGRLLLYRVGEDKGVFSRELSGDAFAESLAGRQADIFQPTPALDLATRIRSRMQGFLPAVYTLGEFDWWLVPEDKRETLLPAARAWLTARDLALDSVLTDIMSAFDAYFFDAVDIDVWRNVYQHYLPPDERQRLGGFYTPDELIGLVLDLADYRPEHDGLCKKVFVDPACGSGAFITSAVSRLLDHLERPMSCHDAIHSRRKPQWQKSMEVLEIVQRNTHGIDIHPFAAFLTTVNILFLVLHLYARALKGAPNATLSLEVFSHDTLAPAPGELLSAEEMAHINSRIELTRNSLSRYRSLLDLRFDIVFGNPPWGGVLKGPLAPVYEDARKRLVKETYPAAATGKFDIYGVFLERATQLLKPGGRLAMVTQDTYVDKQWAKRLRGALSERMALRWLVSLNPFGQLFFGAMNTPFVTVADRVQPEDDGEVFVITPNRPPQLAGVPAGARRARVIAHYDEVAGRLKQGEALPANAMASGRRIGQSGLAAQAGDRWLLEEFAEAPTTAGRHPTALDLLEPSQGVTPGGQGVLARLILTRDEAAMLAIEAEVVYPVVKGIDVGRWRCLDSGRALIYPYADIAGAYHAAFRIEPGDASDPEIAEALEKLGVDDGLDFDFLLDDYEKETARLTDRSHLPAALLQHRVTLGLVRFPGLAGYLVGYYDLLERRILKKKNIRKFGRRWYEYAWPRNPQVMTAAPKLISPRLCRQPRFALDTEGVVPQDSCICLAPNRSAGAWLQLSAALAGLSADADDQLAALYYCLAFLNSRAATEQLRRGQPTPKGSYTVNDAYLARIDVPLPTPDASKAVETVGRLLRADSAPACTALERELDALVTRALGAAQ